MFLLTLQAIIAGSLTSSDNSGSNTSLGKKYSKSQDTNIEEEQISPEHIRTTSIRESKPYDKIKIIQKNIQDNYDDDMLDEENNEDIIMDEENDIVEDIYTEIDDNIEETTAVTVDADNGIAEKTDTITDLETGESETSKEIVNVNDDIMEEASELIDEEINKDEKKEESSGEKKGAFARFAEMFKNFWKK